MYRSLGRDELVAYYCASDIALITPLKDGMNLIAQPQRDHSELGIGAIIPVKSIYFIFTGKNDIINSIPIYITNIKRLYPKIKVSAFCESLDGGRIC